MEANEKMFRHSFGKIVLTFLGILFLGLLAFSINQTELNYFLFAMVGVSTVISLFYVTSNVRISSEEITTTRFLISKSLRWSDIARVSMRGQTLRLHNRDEDLILSIDPQLEGYKEIVNIIFNKRSDLFDNNENTLSSNWLINISILAFGLFIIATFGFYFFVSKEAFEKIFSGILFALGVSIVVVWLFLPKRFALQGRNLIVGYLFQEVSYSVNEIDSISLEKRNTKNGYIYFVQIDLQSGKKIRLPTFKQGNVLAYQVLRRWYEKTRNVAREGREHT